MLLVVSVVLAIRTQVIHVCILKVFGFCNTEHLVSFCGIEELALGVEEFQGVPHSRIVAGSNDDAATSPFHRDCDFGCGSRGESDVDYVEAHSHKRSANHILHHRSGDAGISADHYLVALDRSCTADEGCVGRCELYYIEGIERVSSPSSDGSSDSRD